MYVRVKRLAHTYMQFKCDFVYFWSCQSDKRRPPPICYTCVTYTYARIKAPTTVPKGLGLEYQPRSVTLQVLTERIVPVHVNIIIKSNLVTW